MSGGAQTQPARPNVFPFLRYDDPAAAIDWLIKAFGFEKQVVYAAPDGSIAHAEVRLGPGIVMLGASKDDELRMRSARGLPAVNQGVYIAVEAVDAHYERAKAAGAEIVRDIEDTPYGSREYTARDLEGHLWSFGTYWP